LAFIFETRSADSSCVDTIWRTRSERAGSFISRAVSQWEMVVTRREDGTTLTVRGPETKATPAPIPEDAEFVGITFRLGAFLPHLPVRALVDGTVTLPEATRTSFWLQGSAWRFPDYANADTFVEKLVRRGLLVRDPVVEAALRGHLTDLSARSVQRRVVRATGLTRGAIGQIDRARRAVALLECGVSILDTVGQAGYVDQPHLTKSLRRFIGQTPAQIVRQRRPE
jgi:AraC-like DNA-binding protein